MPYSSPGVTCTAMCRRSRSFQTGSCGPRCGARVGVTVLLAIGPRQVRAHRGVKRFRRRQGWRLTVAADDESRGGGTGRPEGRRIRTRGDAGSHIFAQALCRSAPASRRAWRNRSGATGPAVSLPWRNGDSGIAATPCSRIRRSRSRCRLVGDVGVVQHLEERALRCEQDESAIRRPAAGTGRARR